MSSIETMNLSARAASASIRAARRHASIPKAGIGDNPLEGTRMRCDARAAIVGLLAAACAPWAAAQYQVAAVADQCLKLENGILVPAGKRP